MANTPEALLAQLNEVQREHVQRLMTEMLKVDDSLLGTPPQYSKEELRAAFPIQKGLSLFDARCPFCSRMDLLRAYPDSGRYWCIKCKKGGDIFSYVQASLGCGFSAALTYLRSKLDRGTEAPLGDNEFPF